MAGSKVQVFLACSIDGFIAGPEHDLSWLPGAEPDTAPGASEASGASGASGASEVSGALRYERFIEGIGALLMGRNTYDVVRGFDVEWPYGERPVLVVTRRPLDGDPPPTVRSVSGEISELVDQAKSAAAGKGVYLDGGSLIRQAAEADLLDELTISLAPIALGEGVPLFAGLGKQYAMEIVSHHDDLFGMVQIRARPKRA